MTDYVVIGIEDNQYAVCNSQDYSDCPEIFDDTDSAMRCCSMLNGDD